MDLNIKSPENDLENLTYDQIMSAQYEDMNIDSSEKMAYTIGRFIKEGKGVAACKYFLEYVDNDDIEYAKTYIYSIYDIITFKKQSTFEIMALNLIELKCLGQTDVAVNEFCKYAVCDIQNGDRAEVYNVIFEDIRVELESFYTPEVVQTDYSQKYNAKDNLEISKIFTGVGGTLVWS